MMTSCGQTGNKTTDSVQAHPSSTLNNLPTSLHLTKKNILGSWTNCATRSSGVVIKVNVCKIIEFKSDNSAVITYPSKEKQIVNWTISNDQLIINLTENKSYAVNRMLTDSIYETYLKQDSIGFDLELKVKNKDVIYFLGLQ